MKKRITSTLLIVTIAMTVSLSSVFAEVSLKSIDSTLSNEIVEKKMNMVFDILDKYPSTFDMIQFPDGSEYCVETFDLGDNCQLSVELIDQSEGRSSDIYLIPMTSSGSNQVWKSYGNRYFTAKATVKIGSYSVTLGLENHYILSADGIDENYGISIQESNNTKCTIVPGSPVITDSSARTVGASDVNMYCNFSCKSGAVSDRYKLDTAVKYLAHNKTEKTIRVGHAWNITKLS